MLRIGIDLVSVKQIRDTLADHGDRYLQRIYTSEEVADARGDPRRLAARFAAKEAALKVLRPEDESVPWKHIRVRRHPSGWTDLELSGRAADLARKHGLDDWAVSLTHEGDHASAVVVATTRTPTATDQIMNDNVRKVLQDHARLSIEAATLATDADLYEAGMTSHASVNVMLALEDHFDVEFPDEMLKPSVFASIAAISAAIEQLRGNEAAA